MLLWRSWWICESETARLVNSNNCNPYLHTIQKRQSDVRKRLSTWQKFLPSLWYFIFSHTSSLYVVLVELNVHRIYTFVRFEVVEYCFYIYLLSLNPCLCLLVFHIISVVSDYTQMSNNEIMSSTLHDIFSSTPLKILIASVNC